MEDGGSAGTEEHPSQTPPQTPSGQSRTWMWVAAGLVALAIVGVLIGSRLGGLTGPLSSGSGGNGRPTIVVGTAVAAPSVAVSGPSPSPGPSTVVAGATTVAAATQYVVQPGDTLRSIAQDQYGDAEQWPRIYDANRDTIGGNPDALVAGTTLQIPPRQ
jgi:LysM repeat protein